MTEPAQTIRAEIARVREEHRDYTYPPGNCSLCGQSYPCDAIRLAAALEVYVEDPRPSLTLDRKATQALTGEGGGAR